MRWLDLCFRNITPLGIGGWGSEEEEAFGGMWVRRLLTTGSTHCLGAAGRPPGSWPSGRVFLGLLCRGRGTAKASRLLPLCLKSLIAFQILPSFLLPVSKAL